MRSSMARCRDGKGALPSRHKSSARSCGLSGANSAGLKSRRRVEPVSAAQSLSECRSGLPGRWNAISARKVSATSSKSHWPPFWRCHKTVSGEQGFVQNATLLLERSFRFRATFSTGAQRRKAPAVLGRPRPCWGIRCWERTRVNEFGSSRQVPHSSKNFKAHSNEATRLQKAGADHPPEWRVIHPHPVPGKLGIS